MIQSPNIEHRSAASRYIRSAEFPLSIFFSEEIYEEHPPNLRLVNVRVGYLSISFPRSDHKAHYDSR